MTDFNLSINPNTQKMVLCCLIGVDKGNNANNGHKASTTRKYILCGVSVLLYDVGQIEFADHFLRFASRVSVVLVLIYHQFCIWTIMHNLGQICIISQQDKSALFCILWRFRNRTNLHYFAIGQICPYFAFCQFCLISQWRDIVSNLT